MVHPIRHQVNSRVLHRGLFTDEQLMPAAILVLLAVGVGYSAGSLTVGTFAASLFLLPVAAMIIDNRAGQLLHGQLRTWLSYRRDIGVYDPGAGDAAIGYELLPDEEMLLAGAASAAADLQSVLED